MLDDAGVVLFKGEHHNFCQSLAAKTKASTKPRSVQVEFPSSIILSYHRWFLSVTATFLLASDSCPIHLTAAQGDSF
jgi:hypothetical protein